MIYITQISNFFARLFFRLYHYILLPSRYKIDVSGLKQIDLHKTDPKGGFLFLSNHPSHLDASIIGTMLLKQGHRISIWTLDYVFKNPYTRLVARNVDSTKLLKVPNVHENRSLKNSVKIRKLIRRTVEGLHEGENILFFPAGAQKYAAREEINGKSAVEKILHQYPNVNIVLVRITGLWGSRFSKAVRKSERSNIKGGKWYGFVWKIFKMFVLNFLFFIPKRNVTILFTPAGADFPRQGTRKEINTYLEDFFNDGYGEGGEPLQRVPNYFWKSDYVPNEYHIKCYNFDLHQVPEKIQKDVIATIAAKAHLDPSKITPDLLLDRDLSLDSLEITEILIDLEQRYKISKFVPKHITTVGHLMALIADAPIEYIPIRGEFPVVKQESAFVIRAWQACAAIVASVFGIVDSQK